MSTENFTEATKEINALLKQLTTTDLQSQSALRLEILELYWKRAKENKRKII